MDTTTPATGVAAVATNMNAPRLFYSTIGALTFTALDGISTHYLIKKELATELNPLVDYLIASIGIGPAMLTRVVIGFVLVLSLAYLIKKQPTLEPVMLLVLFFLSGVMGFHAYGYLYLLS